MRTALLAIILASGIALPKLPSLGIGDFERGNRLYRQGHYAEAVVAYQEALAHGKDTPEVRYNLGTALLQLQKYPEAEQHLRAALTDVDPAMRQRVYYNLGNRFLLDARSAAPEDTAQQTKLFDSAIDSYKQSLRLQPDDRDAKWNLELALREKKPPKKDSGGGGQSKNQSQNQDQKNKSSSGGAGSSQSPSAPNGQQQGQNPEQRPLNQQQADRILSAAQQDERQLYKERLKKGQREMPVTRDW